MVGVPGRTPGRRSAVLPYGGGLDYVLFPGSMRPPRRARVSCHQWWVVVVVSLGSSAPFQAALRSGMGSESHLPRAPGVGCDSLKGGSFLPISKCRPRNWSAVDVPLRGREACRSRETRTAGCLGFRPIRVDAGRRSAHRDRSPRFLKPLKEAAVGIGSISGVALCYCPPGALGACPVIA